MRLLRPMVAALTALVLAHSAPATAAQLLIEIDKSNQRMTVSRDGTPLYRWPVSTGTRRYETPSGAFTPFRMEKTHFSREWDDAPMPHSIFFTKAGHAIHGSEHRRAIGRPASHGCVRLAPQNARVLFDLVKREGMANTRVVLAGVTPAPPATTVARHTPPAARRPATDSSARRLATAPDRGRRSYGDGNDGRDERFDRLYPDERFGRDEHIDRDERAYRDERDDGRAGYRTGYWVQYPDGSRVFFDSERDPRMPPPPFFFGRPMRGY